MKFHRLKNHELTFATGAGVAKVLHELDYYFV